MTYRLPDGSVTDTLKVYLHAWRLFARHIEALTGWHLTSFDPDMVLAHEGVSVVLPLTFAQALVDGHQQALARAGKLKPPKVALRVTNCRDCGVEVHSVGRGRTRMFCRECVRTHKK